MRARLQQRNGEWLCPLTALLAMSVQILLPRHAQTHIPSSTLRGARGIGEERPALTDGEIERRPSVVLRGMVTGQVEIESIAGNT